MTDEKNLDLDPATATVAEVVDAAKENPELAEDLLKAEKDGKERVTAVAALEEIVEKANEVEVDPVSGQTIRRDASGRILHPWEMQP